VDQADFVSFTGSSATGRVVAQQAARRLVGCSLELGGKNPMIVRSDADLEAAVAGAVRGCFTNAGQLCIAIERLYAHATVYERFVAALAERARSLRLGSGFDFDADMGSLISKAHFDKVVAHVEDARAKGVTVVAGGHARPDAGPYFFQPTVLTGVTPQMRLYSEETFGPVVAVYPFSSDEEAVALANDSCYGLNASVWTRDVDEGLRMAERIEAGAVNINDAYTATWASLGAPQGGVKESGLGRRHGAEGLLKYTVSQTVSVQRRPPLDFMTGPLAGPRLQRLIPRLLMLRRRLPGID
jgi:acyl-CoA reductase-like NAD-dependent aldehyde dehydrogenase